MSIRRKHGRGAVPAHAAAKAAEHKGVMRKKTSPAAVFVFMAAVLVFMFTAPAHGIEITGAATPDVSGNTGVSAPRSGGLFGNMDVVVTSSVFEPVASGTASGNGTFALEADPPGDGAWYFIETGTQTQKLMGFATGSLARVDPVTDTLAWAMIESRAPVNFTAGELAFIMARLYEQAANADVKPAHTAEAAVEALLSHEAYRLSLGDLVNSYATPGDTLEDVNTLNQALIGIIPNLSDLDHEAARAMLTDKTEFNIEGRVLKGAALLAFIRDYSSRTRVLKRDVRYLHTRIDGDLAQVETIEESTTQDKATGAETPGLMSNFSYELERVDGAWRIRTRAEKECVPQTARILADGSSRDWLGIRPCITKFTYRTDSPRETVALKSIYFARNETGFFWRLENENNLFDRAGGPDPVVPLRKDLDLTYVLVMRDRNDDTATPVVNSVVGIKDGIPYALNEIQRTAPDGFPESATYLPVNFRLTPHYVEGFISTEEMKAAGDEFYVNAWALLNGTDGKSEILSVSVTLKVRMPASQPETD